MKNWSRASGSQNLVSGSAISASPAKLLDNANSQAKHSRPPESESLSDPPPVHGLTSPVGGAHSC